MPSHEPETAGRAGKPRPDAGFSSADRLATEIRDIVNGASPGDIMLALGYVSARVFVKTDKQYHDTLDQYFAHGFDHGMKQ